jgi:hypothetical protein
VVLFEDETDLLLFPPLQGGWSPRGQALEVPISGRNARRTLFGTINPRSGHRLLMARQHQRATDFQAFMEMVRWHYRGWHVTLLLDEDSSHTAEETRSLAEDLDMEFLSLPHRAPELNAMDQLWRRSKQTISGNLQYGSIEDHVDRFIEYVLRLTPSEALCKAGLLSPNFWLRGCLGLGR